MSVVWACLGRGGSAPSNNHTAGVLASTAEAAKIGGVEDVAMLKMVDAGAQHIIYASEEVGVDATLSHAAQPIWRRAPSTPATDAARPSPVTG